MENTPWGKVVSIKKRNLIAAARGVKNLLVFFIIIISGQHFLLRCVCVTTISFYVYRYCYWTGFVGKKNTKTFIIRMFLNSQTPKTIINNNSIVLRRTFSTFVLVKSQKTTKHTRIKRVRQRAEGEPIDWNRRVLKDVWNERRNRAVAWCRFRRQNYHMESNETTRWRIVISVYQVEI